MKCVCGCEYFNIYNYAIADCVECGEEFKGNLNDYYEKCVDCGVETDVPVITPVVQRKNYFEGSGQRCISCAEAIYNDLLMKHKCT